MRRLWNVLKWPVGFLVVVVLAIVAARVVNHFRYPNPTSPTQSPWTRRATPPRYRASR